MEKNPRKNKNKLNSSRTSSCFVLVRKRNCAAISLKGTIMNQPPDDYYRIHKNVVAVRDKKTKKIVLVVSFTQFKDIEGKNEYADLNKLTKSLMQLRTGSNLVSSNGAQRGGEMYALGWRGGIDPGLSLGLYVMPPVIQRSEKAMEEWQGFRAESSKWISNFYSNRFLSLAPHIFSKIKREARQSNVPKLGQMEFENLHQVAHGFSSNLTYTIHDFYNEFHKDKDHTSYAYGLWAPIFDNDGRLAQVKDGFHCKVDILLYLPIKSMSSLVAVMVLWRFFGEEKRIIMQLLYQSQHLLLQNRGLQLKPQRV
jgi:hypothetical protein